MLQKSSAEMSVSKSLQGFSRMLAVVLCAYVYFCFLNSDTQCYMS